MSRWQRGNRPADSTQSHYRNIREDAPPVRSSPFLRLINSLSSSPFLIRYLRLSHRYRDISRSTNCSRVIVEYQCPLIREKQGPPMESVWNRFVIDCCRTPMLSSIVKFDRFYTIKKVERLYSHLEEID